MANLPNHVILYDAECPMCRLYTNAFVKTGMLDSDGRAAYQHEHAINACPQVDIQRAVNEIALVNKETGEVVYGIQSLFKVLGTSFPVFKWLFTCRPFTAFMSKVYAFVSYNRRVIIPAPVNSYQFAVQPAFKLHYRLAYLVFAWLVTACILSGFTPLLRGVIPAGGFYREFVICGGQLLFQGLIVGLYQREKCWDYLGNMMTISLAGALLLVPALALKNYLSMGGIGYSIYFMVVAGLMFLEHLRRCRLLEIGWLPSVSWITYRLLVLWLLFKI